MHARSNLERRNSDSQVMYQSQTHLLKVRRFLPLFITQFLGAMNDNLFKNALVILILFRTADASEGQILVTVAAGIFILPFFLFSANAGQLADKLEKSRMIRLIKFAEILIMCLATSALLLDPAYFQLKTYMLMAVLFLMGTQSAFFGPLKYSILPDHLDEDELIGGNALINAATFLAILIGTIAGGLLILREALGEVTQIGPFLIALDGKGIVSLGILSLAMAGFVASFWIPRAGPADPGLKLQPNMLVETGRVVAHAREHRGVFLAILGISWFWLVGATFLAQIPAFVKDTLGANEEVVTLFLTIFSVGIGLGALLCNRLLKGAVSAKYVPLGALGISLAIFVLYVLAGDQVPGESPLNAAEFLARPASWSVVAALLLLAVFGGIYIVPLYAIMQRYSPPAFRARVIAANNILNAGFMVVSAALTVAFLSQGLTVPEIFLIVAAANLAVALYLCKLLPEAVVKPFLQALLRLLFGVELRGVENYRAAGERVLIVANHVSWLDGLLLASFLPDKPTFAVNTYTAQQWWAGPFLSMIDFFPIDPTRPLTTKSLIKEVRAGRRCVIFPEGRLTVTGALMKVYEGPAMIADKADAEILPVRIDGAQFSKLSRLKGKLRLRWFPKITLTILPPQRFALPPELRGRARRHASGTELYDLMSDLIFETCNRRRTLFDALADAGATHGRDQPVVEDIERRPLDYAGLLAASQVMGRHLAKAAKPKQTVGLLLPNAVGTVVTFFGLQAFGRVPAMLNYTGGLKAMDAACRAAGIRTIVTSRRFLKQAKLADTLDLLTERRRVIYLEDLRESLGPVDRLYGLVAGRFAQSLHRARCRRQRIGPDSPAVVLFTSGSEGLPKAVVLSHANILANVFQLGARIDFNPTDIAFNALPLFHSFGLSAGLILPASSGVKTFLYPTPLHYRIIPEMVYETNATVMFGTDTFLSGYARAAHAYDFYALRYVFAGAEKVKPETRRSWAEKFGLRILEGYGATETAPVISTNTPMQYKAGTVGRLLPGIEHRLEPVPGIDRGGRLLVKGPNVMLGYYRVERPMELEPPEDGWYDTGDIVEIDDEGFVTIAGRAKRFAKIAGEMVSLTAVEAQAAALWPAAGHAVLSLPDDRKGEQLVLLTEQIDANREAFLAHAQAAGLTELMVPRLVLAGHQIPLLGSGKVDYVAAKALVEDISDGRLPGVTVA